MESNVFLSQLELLMQVDETSDPLVSAYLDWHDPKEALVFFERRRGEIAASFTGRDLESFERACDRLLAHLGQQPEGTRGLALFCRAGEEPFFLELKFEVPFEPVISADYVPSVFPLVELKDNYDSYLLWIVGESEARVMEVSLGAITRKLWSERPKTRRRVGREWTKDHYQSHRQNKIENFLREQIDLLKLLSQKRGETHIIMAGRGELVNRVRKLLPRSLSDSVVDIVNIQKSESPEDVVRRTLQTFLEHEERESLALAELVRRSLRRGHLAEVGFERVLDALAEGCVDIVVMNSEVGHEPTKRYEVESVIRLAEKTGAQVEVVMESDVLKPFGGIGCLLRYERPWANRAEELAAPGICPEEGNGL